MLIFTPIKAMTGVLYKRLEESYLSQSKKMMEYIHMFPLSLGYQ